MANSLHFNDIDLSTYGLKVLRGPLPMLGQADVQTIGRLGQDGGTSRPSRWASRVLTVPCVIEAATYTAMQTALGNIATALAQAQDCALWFDHQTDRYWMARFVGPAAVTPLDGRFATVDLEFLASDPHAHAITPSQATDTIASGVSSDTSAFAVGGTWYAWPTVSLVASTTSSAVAIGNETLDEKAQWNSPGAAYDVQIGDTIRFRCDPLYWDVSIKRTGEDDYTVYMSGFEGRFPRLRPAVTETLTFWGISGALTVDWENTYL